MEVKHKTFNNNGEKSEKKTTSAATTKTQIKCNNTNVIFYEFFSNKNSKWKKKHKNVEGVFSHCWATNVVGNTTKTMLLFFQANSWEPFKIGFMAITRNAYQKTRKKSWKNMRRTKIITGFQFILLLQRYLLYGPQGTFRRGGVWDTDSLFPSLSFCYSFSCCLTS